MFLRNESVFGIVVGVVLMVSAAVKPAGARSLLDDWFLWQGVDRTTGWEAQYDPAVSARDSFGDPAASLWSNRHTWTASGPGLSKRLTLRLRPTNDSHGFQTRNRTEVKRLQYRLEDERTVVPHRLRFGEFEPALSRHGLESPLKGLELTFEPDLIGPGTNTSLLLVNGIVHPDWQQLGDYEGSIHGATWTVQSGGTKFDLRYLHNRRRESPDRSFYHENVLGLSMADRLESLPGKASVEIEADWFTGEIPDGGDERNGVSYHVTVKNAFRDFGWNYVLHYRDHSRDYRPTGVAVPSDRESLTVDLRGELLNQTIRLHGENLKRNVSSSTPGKDRRYALSTTGAWGGGFTSQLQTALRDREQAGARDERVETARLKLLQDWTSRLRFEYGVRGRLHENDLSDPKHQIMYEGSLGVEYRLQNTLGRQGDGTLRTGLTARTTGRDSTNRPRSSREWEPYWDASYGLGNHAFSVRWNAHRHSRSGFGDVTTYDGRIGYEYRLTDNHTLDVSYDYRRRDAETGSDAEENKLFLDVTWRFDAPGGRSGTTPSRNATSLLE